MLETREGLHQNKKEQLNEPEYTQETLQYADDQLALYLTGERGAKFNFDEHKWSPTERSGEAIITTESGNEYHMFNRRHHIYIVNTNESEKQGKLVIGRYAPNITPPPIEFGKPWKIPGFYTTTEVDSVLLRYKVVAPGKEVGHKIDSPNPFDKYQRLLGRLAPKRK